MELGKQFVEKMEKKNNTKCTVKQKIPTQYYYHEVVLVIMYKPYRQNGTLRQTFHHFLQQTVRFRFALINSTLYTSSTFSHSMTLYYNNHNLSRHFQVTFLSTN